MISPELTEAINAATATRLRTVLLRICENNHHTRSSVSEELLIPEVTDNASLPDKIDSRKRKRYEVCAHCDKEYEAEKNKYGQCVYHPGAKEVDEESGMWDDTEDDVHGSPYQYKDDPEFEDGFYWECCRGEIKSKGCVTDKHEPIAQGSRTKRRES